MSTICRTLFLTVLLLSIIPASSRAAELTSPAAKPAVGPGSEADKVAEINRVPYIAFYYVQPKVNLSDKPVINYYLTDYDHKEYLRDDHSEAFTVDYWVNGEKTTLQNVKAGDNSIALATLPKGKILIALQATDSKGRKSGRLYQEFLIIDPADEQIPADKVLTPELGKYGIYNDDTHPVETTQGLTTLLKWASDNGYRKVVLPAGKYRLDETKAVQMATKLTLDMNGATFKLNPNALGSSLMFEFVDCFDSHLVNGTLEGDLKEHDFKNAPNNSEWLNAVCISQGSEYCTVKDITIIDITGYGSTTMHRQAYSPSQEISGFALGDIDAKGAASESKDRTTSDGFKDLSKFKYGFIQLGVYLGYQGNPAEHWVYKAHFYDKDQKYLESIEAGMYRRLYFPKEAQFAKFTLYSTATPKDLTVFDFRAPYNCAFINVQHKNVRCVGMALAGFNNLLVEGCTFENCGWDSAQCAFDAEDGWDMMQDLTFRNNTFLKNPNHEYLLAGGHNFVMEKNTMSTVVWERNNGFVFKDNTIKHANFRFDLRQRTGYPRISGNTMQGPVQLILANNTPDSDYAIRNNTLNDGVSTVAKPATWDHVYAYKDAITGGTVTTKLVECTLKDGVNNAGPSFNLTKTLAYGKPVTATIPGEGDHVASNAVDGFIDNASAWWAGQSPASLTVDLQNVETIDRLKVYTHHDGVRFYQYTVELSVDGKDWKQVVDMSTNTKLSTGDGDEHSFNSMQARYVRVNMLKNSVNAGVHLREIQVFPAQAAGQ